MTRVVSLIRINNLVNSSYKSFVKKRKSKTILQILEESKINQNSKQNLIKKKIKRNVSKIIKRKVTVKNLPKTTSCLSINLKNKFYNKKENLKHNNLSYKSLNIFRIKNQNKKRKKNSNHFSHFYRTMKSFEVKTPKPKVNWIGKIHQKRRLNLRRKKFGPQIFVDKFNNNSTINMKEYFSQTLLNPIDKQSKVYKKRKSFGVQRMNHHIMNISSTKKRRNKKNLRNEVIKSLSPPKKKFERLL